MKKYEVIRHNPDGTFEVISQWLSKMEANRLKYRLDRNAQRQDNSTIEVREMK